MAQDNPFDQFDTQPAAPARAPRPLRGAPPPQDKVAAEKRDEIRTNIAIEGAGRDARKEQRDVDKDRRDTEIRLSNDFSADPEVKSYRAAMPLISSALRPRGKSGQTDLTLIYAYAKLMDPTTGVREGEMANAQNTSPWAQTQIQNLQNQLDGSGMLPPAVKRGLEQEIIGNARARRKAYEARRNEFSANAEAYGLDPIRVVGQHSGDAFREDVLAYDKEHGLGRFKDVGHGEPENNGGGGGGNGLALPDMRYGLPKGTKVEMGANAWFRPEEAFDREAYLKDTYGISPDQEQWLVSFWNQNSGNPDLTVAGVRQAFAANNVPWPEGPGGDAALSDTIAKAKQGHSFGGFDTSGARSAYESKLDKFNQINGAITDKNIDPNSMEAYGRRAETGLTAGLRDEIQGVGGFFGGLVNGMNPTETYKLYRDADRRLQEQESEAQGVTGDVVEFVGSLPTAALGGEARTPLQMAKVGAKFGAVSGFGHGQGLGNSLVGATSGASLGGVLGGALGVGAEKASPYLGRVSELVSTKAGRGKAIPEGFNADLVAAGERQNIPIRQPDAVPSMRGDMASAEASPYGGGLIANALRNDKAAVETRLSEIGGKGESMVGDSMDYSLGKMGRKVGEDFIERTRVQKNDLYGEAEQLASGQRIVPEQAIAAVDRHIAELEARGANTNGPTISYLKGLREDMNAPGGFSITEFQGLRSGASQKIKGDQALTSSDADRRLGDVVKAFTADAEAQLPQGAAAKLAEADAFYAQRQEFIDGTLKKLIGTRGRPASSEEVGKRLVAMTRNKADAETLGRVLREATPEQRADFAATIAENLGLARNGEFSLGALATNVSKTPGNVRVLIFGKEGNTALSDLQAIARAKSETAGGLNNSRSGVVMVRDMAKRLLFSSTVGAGAGGAGGGTSGAVMGGVVIPAATEFVTAIGQRRAAKLLLDTNFTKWLRQAPKKATVQEANAYVDKLAKALSVNPETAAIADNVVPLFRDRLTGSASQSATAAAANDEKQDRRRQPPGQ